jgi:hypothetical protein
MQDARAGYWSFAFPVLMLLTGGQNKSTDDLVEQARAMLKNLWAQKAPSTVVPAPRLTG